jgi:hypothetical protein
MKYCLLHVISGTYVSNRIYTFDAAGAWPAWKPIWPPSMWHGGLVWGDALLSNQHVSHKTKEFSSVEEINEFYIVETEFTKDFNKQEFEVIEIR